MSSETVAAWLYTNQNDKLCDGGGTMSMGIHLSIRHNRNLVKSNAQMGIGHSTGAFRFRMH